MARVGQWGFQGCDCTRQGAGTECFLFVAESAERLPE